MKLGGGWPAGVAQALRMAAMKGQRQREHDSEHWKGRENDEGGNPMADGREKHKGRYEDLPLARIEGQRVPTDTTLGLIIVSPLTEERIGSWVMEVKRGGIEGLVPETGLEPASERSLSGF